MSEKADLSCYSSVSGKTYGFVADSGFFVFLNMSMKGKREDKNFCYY